MPKDRTIAVLGELSDVYLASIAASQVSSRREQSVRDLPRWARWNGVLERRYTLGVEEDSAALIALVQSLARLELEGEPADRDVGPEVLAENRFLAARDGSTARLIDPIKRHQLVSIRELAEATLATCRSHAAALGCTAELNQIHSLPTANGADRQRARAEEAGLVELVSTLVERFAAPIR